MARRPRYRRTRAGLREAIAEAERRLVRADSEEEKGHLAASRREARLAALAYEEAAHVRRSLVDGYRGYAEARGLEESARLMQTAAWTYVRGASQRNAHAAAAWAEQWLEEASNARSHARERLRGMKAQRSRYV